MNSRWAFIGVAVVIALLCDGARAETVKAYTNPDTWPKWNDKGLQLWEKEEWGRASVRIAHWGATAEERLAKVLTVRGFTLNLGAKSGGGEGYLNIEFAKMGVKRVEKKAGTGGKMTTEELVDYFSAAKLIHERDEFHRMIMRREAYASKKEAQKRKKTMAHRRRSIMANAGLMARLKKEGKVFVDEKMQPDPDDPSDPVEASDPNEPYYSNFGPICPQRLGHPDLLDYYRWLKVDVEQRWEYKSGEPEAKAFATDEKTSCITLNVFTPLKGTNGRHNQQYPVFVFIHGGSLNSGSAALFGIHGIFRQLVRLGIVVVMVQYPVGPHGFLNRGATPLNNGLRVQLEALKWVKTFIPYFGGNPDDITLAGQSAGAASVTVLALEVMHREAFLRDHGRLFHKLVIMSSTVLVKDSREVKDVRAKFLEQLPEPRNASAREVLLADEVAKITNWDFEIRPGSKDGWFSQLPHALFAKQLSAYQGTPILVWGMRDEWAIMDLKVQDKIRVLETYTRNYGYIPFRNFMQPYLALYDFSLIPSRRALMKELSSLWEEVWPSDVPPRGARQRRSTPDSLALSSNSRSAEAEEAPHSLIDSDRSGDETLIVDPKGVKSKVFVPSRWYKKAWDVYAKDLSGYIASKTKTLTHRQDEFHDYYIPVQILSDWYFLLPTLRDAMDFAKHNKVFLAKVVHEANFPERLLPYDSLVAHELDLRFLFMPLRFWRLQRDLGLLHSEPRHLEFAEKISDFLVGFIKHGAGAAGLPKQLPHQSWPRRLIAPSPGKASPPVKEKYHVDLPYAELSHRGAKPRPSFTSIARVELWQRLFNKYGEPPFADEDKGSGNIHPHEFDAERRNAVATALEVKNVATVVWDFPNQAVGKLKAVFGKFVHDNFGGKGAKGRKGNDHSRRHRA